MEEVEWCILEKRIKSLTEKEKLEGAIYLQTLAWEMMDDRRVRLTILLQFLARSLISSQNAKQYTAALRIQIWAMKRLGRKSPIDDPIILDHISSYLSCDSDDDSEDSDENDDDRDEDTILFVALPRKKRLDVIWEEEYEDDDDDDDETDKKDSQQLEYSPRSVVVTCLKSSSLVASSSSSLLDPPMLLPFHKKGTSHHVDDNDNDETTQSSHTFAFRQNNNIHSIMSTTRKKKNNIQAHGISKSVVACRSCTLGGGAFQKTNDNTNYNSSSRRTTHMKQSPFIAVHKQFTGSMMMVGLSSPKTRQRNKKIAYIQVPLIGWFSQLKEIQRSRFVSTKIVLFASLAILIYLNHATTIRGTGMVHNTDCRNCLLLPPSEIKKHSSHHHYTETESSSESNSSFIQNMSQCTSLQRLGPFSKQPRNEPESRKRGHIESSMSSSHHHARYQTLKHLVESILDDLFGNIPCIVRWGPGAMKAMYILAGALPLEPLYCGKETEMHGAGSCHKRMESLTGMIFEALQ
eukprot:scaffold75198_cov55-Attheya_sp.AAC.5